MARPYIVGLTVSAPNPLQHPPKAPGDDGKDDDEDDDNDSGSDSDEWEEFEGDDDTGSEYDDEKSLNAEEEDAKTATAMRAFGADSRPAIKCKGSAWETQVEIEGLHDRVAALPVQTGIYSHLCVLRGELMRIGSILVNLPRSYLQMTR